jgi:hypothetical protein
MALGAGLDRQNDIGAGLVANPTAIQKYHSAEYWKTSESQLGFSVPPVISFQEFGN